MKKLAFLDSLRGIAALYVMLVHLAFMPNQKLSTPLWIEPFTEGGRSGVYLFFIVSAFSLWYTMPRHLDNPKPLWSYFISRLFRIAPLFYFFIAAMLIRYSGDVNLFQFLSNITFTFNLLPETQHSIVWAGWSVGIEMLFYLSVPYLYLKITNLKKATMLFVLTWVIAYFVYDYSQSTKWLTYSIIRFMPVFALGIMSYFVYRDYLTDDKFVTKYKRSIQYLTLLAPMGILLNGLYFYKIYGVYVISFGFAALLVLLAIKPYKIFVNRVFSFFGKLSFSMYLSHPVIIYYSSPIYQDVYKLGFGDIPSLLICYLYTICIVTSSAYVLYHLIEVPGIEYGKKLIVKISGSKVTQANPI